MRCLMRLPDQMLNLFQLLTDHLDRYLHLHLPPSGILRLRTGKQR
jgi:hypothetical protein